MDSCKLFFLFTEMSLLKLRGSLCFNETSLLQYGPDHALAVINSSQIPSEMQQSHTLYSYNNNNSKWCVIFIFYFKLANP